MQSAISKRARDRDIVNVLYFHDYPALQSTGKAYDMAMKCIVKGLWENISVVTAFVLLTYEKQNMRWNRGGSFIFWQDCDETYRGPVHSAWYPIFFHDSELWKGTEKSCKTDLVIGENILQWKSYRVSISGLLKKFLLRRKYQIPKGPFI